MGKQTNQAAVTWHPCGPTFQRLNGFFEVAKSQKKTCQRSKILTLLQGVKWGTMAHVYVCVTHPVFHAVTSRLQFIFPTRQLMTSINSSTPILIRLFIYNHPKFIKQKNIKHINIFNSFQFTNKALRFQPTSSKLVDKLVPPGPFLTPKILSLL